MEPVTAADPAERLRRLAASPSPVPLDEALAFFDALPAVDPEELVGSWEGGVVPTGHKGESQLKLLRWAGKDFRGRDDVDPIVSKAPGGKRVANPVLGSATIRSVEFRGVVTATMVYDRHPIFDHFRRIDAGTVLGVMDRKGEEHPLVFFLRRLGEPAQ